jgi:glc operon protein GlcG
VPVTRERVVSSFLFITMSTAASSAASVPNEIIYAMAANLAEEVGRLLPEFLRDPIDAKMGASGSAVVVIDQCGRIHGRIFGEDKVRGRWCFGIATRKAGQVWQTGYATGRFEELVYAGRLDESTFGLQRPDLIGWLGGVPLRRPDGLPVAAAFSGFRGESDVAIIERAAANIGLTVVRA